MEKTTQLTEPKKGFLRLRLSLSSTLLCFRHLHGKTEAESRAWAMMALEHMAALVDLAGKEVNSPTALALPVAAPNKRPRGKVALHAVPVAESASKELPPRAKLSAKIPGTGSFLSATRSAFKI
jgi:hypothetical protein